MEIQTTVQNFNKQMHQLNIMPDASIKIVINDCATYNQKPEKSRWAKAAERMGSENYLQGKSEQVNKLFRQFRDNFSF